MSIQLLIKAECPEGESDLSFTIPLDKMLMDLLITANEDVQKSIESLMSVEDFGVEKEVTCSDLKQACIETISLFKDSAYSYYTKSEMSKGHTKRHAGTIDGSPMIVESSVGKCLLMKGMHLGENGAICYDEIVDIRHEKEIQTDQGMVQECRKKSKNEPASSKFEELLTALSEYEDDQIFKVVIG